MKRKIFIGVCFCIVACNSLAAPPQIPTPSVFETECKNIDKDYSIVKGVRLDTFSFYSKRISVYKNAKAITVHTIKTNSDERLVLRYVFFDPSPTDNTFVDYLMSVKHGNTLLDICYDKMSNIFAISDHYSE
ncbi:hypothetical protein CA266_23900 (plasmid) [Serratia marcescens]|uniref:hypothetical protein n=1 Tax=Serratia marcescens TaxID=615 RepID=UPI00187EAF2A|nr:hypothetical protein [Serratia marcescens]QOV56308.1 hypothetical protein CA266_23900 [Serratia marcescens]